SEIVKINQDKPQNYQKANAEASSPSLDKIKQKFNRNKDHKDNPGNPRNPDSRKKSDLEDAIIHVRIKGKDTDAKKTPTTKAVVISGSRKKVIGQQG
ncbi:hypothetical protein JW926_13205, partial [Candidatus Sumerlaeota bacterium]|nr:hypothetical protein [Candidatus Sumerlaeota bacterium]